jgi:hypothetical protein
MTDQDGEFVVPVEGLGGLGSGRGDSGRGSDGRKGGAQQDGSNPDAPRPASPAMTLICGDRAAIIGGVIGINKTPPVRSVTSHHGC